MQGELIKGCTPVLVLSTFFVVLTVGPVGTGTRSAGTSTSTSSGYTLRVPIIKGTSFRKEEILGS